MEDRWKMSSTLTVSSKLSTTNTILSSKSSLLSKRTAPDSMTDEKTSVGLKRQQLALDDSAKKSLKSSLEMRPGLQLNTLRLQNDTFSRIDTMKNPLSVNKIQNNGALGKPLKTSALFSSGLKASDKSSVSATEKLKTTGLTTKSTTNNLTMKTSDLKRFLSSDEDNQEEPKKAKITTFPSYPNLADSFQKEDDSHSVFRQENGNEKERTNYIKEIKEKLIQFVSVAAGGLAGELKKKDSDTRKKLDTLVEEITEWDPEFLLKVRLKISI